MLEAIRFFHDHYDHVVGLHIGPSDRKAIRLGSRDGKTCRYCGRSAPTVTFRKKAHALPQFIGNRLITSNDECDLCNEQFGAKYEDAFARFLGPRRALMRLRRKSSLPTFKDRRGHLRVEGKGEALTIKASESAKLVELDTKKKSLVIRYLPDSFVPLAAYKCLLRSAVAALPDDLLSFARPSIGMLRDSSHAYGTPYRPLPVIHTFAPGPMPFPGVHLWVLRRKPAATGCFFLCAVLAFGNDAYQFVIPSTQDTPEAIGGKVKIVSLPLSCDVNLDFGRPVRQILDWTSSEVFVPKEAIAEMGFEEAVDGGSELVAGDDA